MTTKIKDTNITQTGVIPGYYVAANITVNAEGQVLSATSGTVVNTALSHFNYVINGTLYINQGKKRWYAPSNLNIIEIRAYLTQSANSNIVLNIRKNNNIAKVFTIPPNSLYYQTGSISEILMSQSEYLTVDIIQIGSAQKGQNLYMQFIYQ